MLLFSRIGALTYVPASSTTVPPPLPAEHSSIAFWIAAVSLLVPSPFAPYCFTSHTLPAAMAGAADIANTTATAATHVLVSIFISPPSSRSIPAASCSVGPATAGPISALP
jgi:hypothetical protein